MNTAKDRGEGWELLRKDDAGREYMVSFGERRFWLALPPDEEAFRRARLIFVFSGHGGTGATCNLTRGEASERFRYEMYAAGFGFVCAECSTAAWGDEESTEATLAAGEYCRLQGLNTGEKFSLLGFSMGGLGALMFAARHPEKTARVADVFGITDLDRFLEEGFYPEELSKIPQGERRARAPRRLAERYAGIPVLIVHGTEDRIVNISHSETLYAALEAQHSPCRLLKVPGYGHTNEALKVLGPELSAFFRSEGAI